MVLAVRGGWGGAGPVPSPYAPSQAYMGGDMTFTLYWEGGEGVL